MPDLLCTGEALIDFLTDRPGVSLTEARAFTWAAGGAPANVAVAAARLGVDTAFMGKVGKDPFGAHIRETLAASSVDVSHLLATGKARTSLAFVALPTPDDPQFTFFRHPSADMLFRPDDLDADFVRSAQFLHFGSIALIADPCRSTNLTAAEMVRAAGGFVSFDPNYRPALWPAATARERILATLPLCDVVKLNEAEVRLLTGKDDLVDGAEELLQLGPKVCLVTVGAEGSFYVTPRSNGHVPAYSVRTVDAPGCGDGFTAAALKGIMALGDPALLGPLDLEEILRYANAVGALTATKKGGIPALPTAAQVDVFLEEFA